MTNERTTADTDGVSDPRVTATYRSVATERAPASLNERVLREARIQTGSGYSWWMGWLRPMAWAATVGLCLAIVVELSGVPEPELLTPDKSVLEKSTVAAPQQEALPGTTPDRDMPAEKSETRRFETPASLPAPATRASRTQNPGRSDDAKDNEPGTSAEIDVLNITEAPILEDAAEIARFREGPNQDPAGVARRPAVRADERPAQDQAGAVSSLAAAVGKEAFADSPQCGEDARKTPESWLECILEMEKVIDHAADERAALKKAFPAFELP